MTAPAHRLSESRAVLRSLHESGVDRVLIAFSGGKDCLCALDLCVAEWGAENVECFFMYLVRGLEVEMAPIRRALARFRGVKLHETPHWELPRLMKQSVLRAPRPGASGLRQWVLRDVERRMRAETCIEWIVYGEKVSDSISRLCKLRSLGHKTGSGRSQVDATARRLYPIAEWGLHDPRQYLRARKLPIPPHIGPPHSQGGVGLEPRVLSWLAKEHPADFAKLEAVFPYARAAVLKHDNHDAPQAELRRSSRPPRHAAPVAAPEVRGAEDGA